MKPSELDTPEGWLRFNLLHTMCCAAASQSASIGVLSNWALGTTAVYLPLMIGNLDKIQSFIHKSWVGPVFWLSLLSAVVGVGLQVFSIWVQIAVQVETRVMSLALDALRHPDNYDIKIKSRPDWDARFAREIMIPARDEFIESRPGPFRELAIWAKEKAENDPTFLAKNAASCTQIMLPFLAIQYLLLGIAVFWPMGALLWK
jgi:hypothetical protein